LIEQVVNNYLVSVKIHQDMKNNRRTKDKARYYPPEMIPFTLCSACLDIVLEQSEKANEVYEEVIDCFSLPGWQETMDGSWRNAMFPGSINYLTSRFNLFENTEYLRIQIPFCFHKCFLLFLFYRSLAFQVDLISGGRPVELKHGKTIPRVHEHSVVNLVLHRSP